MWNFAWRIGIPSKLEQHMIQPVEHLGSELVCLNVELPIYTDIWKEYKLKDANWNNMIQKYVYSRVQTCVFSWMQVSRFFRHQLLRHWILFRSMIEVFSVAFFPWPPFLHLSSFLAVESKTNPALSSMRCSNHFVRLTWLRACSVVRPRKAMCMVC